MPKDSAGNVLPHNTDDPGQDQPPVDVVDSNQDQGDTVNFTHPVTKVVHTISKDLYKEVQKQAQSALRRKYEDSGLLFDDAKKTELETLKAAQQTALQKQEEQEAALLVSQGKQNDLIELERKKHSDQIKKEQEKSKSFEAAFLEEKRVNHDNEVDRLLRATLSKIPNLFPDMHNDTVKLIKSDYTIHDKKLVISDGNGSYEKAENGIDPADPIPRIMAFLKERPRWLSASNAVTQPALGNTVPTPRDAMSESLDRVAKMNKEGLRLTGQ